VAVDDQEVIPGSERLMGGLKLRLPWGRSRL
jgi:hypothetical protein